MTKQPIGAGDRIIVALDVDSVAKAITLVNQLSSLVGGFKVGLEFITATLANLVTANSEVEANFSLNKTRAFFNMLDGKLFWDGKWDDIPNTVGSTAKALSKLRVKMFNVHAAATINAMMAAVANKGDALALAVTVLTSTEENDCNLTFGAPSKAQVLQFARNAKLAGCDGIVCSPQELKFLRGFKELNGLLRVTPGIRSADAPPDDQNRTMPAGEAIIAGADYLVIGRPITGAEDPVVAAKKITDEIATALNRKEAT